MLSPIKLWPWWYDDQGLWLRPGNSSAILGEYYWTGTCVLLQLPDHLCVVTLCQIPFLVYPVCWYVARVMGFLALFTLQWSRFHCLWWCSFFERGANHRILCIQTKDVWPFCTPHSILPRWLYMTLLWRPFISGGGAWRLLSPSRATISPAWARKSKTSSKSSKSGTALESCVCRCHSNIVVWSSLSPKIDVTDEAKVSYFITLRARRCCLATSWRRRSSLLLPSFSEGASRMARVWARCIKCGWS